MASQQQPSQNVTQLPQSQSRQAAEEARKDRTLAEFLLMLDDYEPLVCLFISLFHMFQWNLRFQTKLPTISFNGLVLSVKMLACASYQEEIMLNLVLIPI